ncbi:hypothetical protein LCGC14_0441860 [marine sediment metagenome]|uniref:Uncharacterized protein n=1 Tax=marine sediment metagenome TaxID=412755 RepID=A0A0F9T3E3_9ZZZZ
METKQIINKLKSIRTKAQRITDEVSDMIDGITSSLKQKFQPCGEEFEFMEADNVYKAICGGEDGLCDTCAKQNTLQVKE